MNGKKKKIVVVAEILLEERRVSMETGKYMISIYCK
jgi:hypothetical protein